MAEPQRAMVPAFVQGTQRVAVGAPPEGAETPTAAEFPSAAVLLHMVFPSLLHCLCQRN